MSKCSLHCLKLKTSVIVLICQEVLNPCLQRDLTGKHCLTFITNAKSCGYSFVNTGLSLSLSCETTSA